MAPRLVIAASSQSFDQTIISHWQDEGFEVRFEPVRDDSRSSITSIESIGDTLEAGEKYAIVSRSQRFINPSSRPQIAYGHAAKVILRQAFFDPIPKLCALVAFYPPSLPDATSTPPQNLRVIVHLAGNQPFAPRYKSYSYPSTNPGFDQEDSGVHDKLASSLAWSRSLDCVRKGFGINVDIEAVLDNHLLRRLPAIHLPSPEVRRQLTRVPEKHMNKDGPAVVKTLTTNPPPHLTYSPILTGYSPPHTPSSLLKFYTHLYIPGLPPSFTSQLLSRTIGSDRIVDEVMVSFTHSITMKWILPGVPATNKRVEIPMVNIVKIRGNRVESEHVYWDQASVLVQVGLLDAKKGAIGLGGKGVVRLPIAGVESAKKVLDEESVKSNGYVPGW